MVPPKTKGQFWRARCRGASLRVLAVCTLAATGCAVALAGGPAGASAALARPTSTAPESSAHGTSTARLAGGTKAAPATKAHEVPPPFDTKPGEIIRVAGGGPVAVPTSGIPALYANLSNPGGVAVDAEGDVFIADTDNNEIREVTPAGVITTIAGNGIAGNTGNGGSATAAELDHPEGVAVDGDGNVYIADTDNNEIKVVSGGDIFTIAGDGFPGYSGDGGAPTSAELYAPYGIAVSPNGSEVAIGDTDNNVVRLLYKHYIIDQGSSPHGAAAPRLNFPFVWEIETLAGGGTSYGDGGPAIDATLSTPTGVAFDATGDDVYIADTGDSAVREVDLSSGDISTAAFTPYPTGIAVDAAGDLFISDAEQNLVLEQPAGASTLVRIAGLVLAGDSGDGGPATAALLDYPAALALDSYGDVFIADTSNDRIREIVAARAPYFTGDTPPLDAGAHQAYDYLFSAPAVPEPKYSLSGAPSWLAISAATGLVEGTLPVGVKSFTYSVVAKNASGSATAGPYTVTVPLPYVYEDTALAVFSDPVGVGTEANGDLLVTDPGRSRIAVLHPDGQIIGYFGSAGSGNGQFDDPTGVTVNAAGDIWVVDQGNNRLEEFSPAGVFLKKVGTKGDAWGQFDDPSGITLGPDDELYVSDSGNDRIEVFTGAGAFVSTFGTAGSGNGELNGPEGLAFTSAGILLVADSTNDRIEAFLGGHYFGQFGKSGSALGEFVRPCGVAVDPSGNIFVTDRVNARIEMFSSTGEPIQAFTSNASPSVALGQPYGISVSTHDIVTVASPGEHHVLQFDEEAPPTFTADSPATATTPGAAYDYDFHATGVPTPTYSLSGAPSWLSIDEPSGDLSGTVPIGTTSFTYSVVAKNSISSTTTGPFTVTVLVDGGYLDQFGGYGTTGGLFEGVGGSVTAANGDLYICDPGNDRIDEFTPTGEYLGSFGSFGSGDGELSDPQAIAVDPAGDFWVTDYGNNRVEEFSSEGVYLSQFGSEGTAEGEFDNPGGIAVDPTNDDVYVADISNNRVEQFTDTGTFVREYTEAGGQYLYDPDGIAVTSAGELYVGDNLNGEIIGYNASGTQNATYAGAGDGDGETYGIAGLALDASGNIWVSDYPNDRIEEFSPTGAYLTQFGSDGSGPDQFVDPGELSVSPEGIVTVADTGNSRVEQFAEPPGAPAYLDSFGTEGTGNGQFDEDTDVVTAPNGDLYVVDFRNDRVEWFTASGAYLGQFAVANPSSCTDPPANSAPVGLAFTPDGDDAWVTEEGCNEVVEFSLTGSSPTPTGTEFGNDSSTAGSATGEFDSPRGIAIDPTSGDIYVADVYNHRVEEFSPTGTYLSEIDSASYGAISVIAVAVSASGELYIADYDNGDIVGFDSSGAQNLLFGSEGSGPGEFYEPAGLAVDAAGNLWVADGGNNRIEEFTADGTYICQFGSAGAGDDEFDLPGGLTVSSVGVVSVADLLNNRVEQFTPIA